MIDARLFVVPILVSKRRFCFFVLRDLILKRRELSPQLLLGLWNVILFGCFNRGGRNIRCLFIGRRPRTETDQRGRCDRGKQQTKVRSVKFHLMGSFEQGG